MIEIISSENIFPKELKIKHWGNGEWIDEVDLIKFKYKDFDCLIRRMGVPEGFNGEHLFGGYLCGYVKIPENSKFYKINYNDLTIDCHGGLSFSDYIDEGWYIGFDCGHYEDFCPSMEQFKSTSERIKEFRKMFPLPEGYEGNILFNPVYRNIEYCTNECKNIVDQLIEVKNV